MSEGPLERPCPYCQTLNVAIARRCRMCLSELPPVAGAPAVAWAVPEASPAAAAPYASPAPAPGPAAPFVQEAAVSASPAYAQGAPYAAPAVPAVAPQGPGPSFMIGQAGPVAPEPVYAEPARPPVPEPLPPGVAAGAPAPLAAQRCARCNALNAPTAQRCHECRSPLPGGTAAAIDQAMQRAQAAMRQEPPLRQEAAGEPFGTPGPVRRRAAGAVAPSARATGGRVWLARLPVVIRLLAVLWLAYSLQDVNGWLKNITRDLGPAEPAALNYTLHALYETVWSVAAVAAIWLVTFVRGRRQP